MWNVNKKMVKVSAVVLSAVLSAGAVGVNVHAANTNETAGSEVKDKITDSVKNVWQPVGEGENAGGETVYVIAGAGGEVQKIIVSNGEELSEETESTENKMPLSMEISYTLDGKEISAEELAGKSGHVVIRCTYTVNQYEMAEVQDKEEKIYVPFAVAAGTILDGAHFQNVTVSSGRVIDDGSRCVVAGIAFPGLSEDLKLEDGPSNYVEIEADVIDFVLDGIYSIATNEIFSDINVDDVTTLDDLKEAMDKMTEAMEALMDGSSALYNGLAELYEKSGDLQNGVSALQAGASQLLEGTTALRDGAVNLTNGLNTLSSKNTELVNGAAQVFNTLLAEANRQLAANGLSVPTLTIDNYSQVLGGVTASLNPDAISSQVYSAVYDAVAAEVKKNEAAIRAGVTQEVQKQVFAGVLQAAGLDESQYNGMPAEQKQAIDSAVEAQIQSEQIKQTIEAAVAAQEKQLIEQNMQSPDIANKIAQETANAANRVNEGAGKIAALKAQLDSYNTFYQGLIAYTNGVAQAESGAEQLAAGAESLNEGAAALKDGMDTLASGSEALIDGVSRLKKGAMELRDGLTTFNEEGINKLTEALDGDYDELFARMQAMTQVSRSYNSYTNEDSIIGGTVKFIYKTSEIR